MSTSEHLIITCSNLVMIIMLCCNYSETETTLIAPEEEETSEDTLPAEGSGAPAEGAETPAAESVDMPPDGSVEKKFLTPSEEFQFKIKTIVQQMVIEDQVPMVRSLDSFFNNYKDLENLPEVSNLVTSIVWIHYGGIKTFQ